LYVNNTLRFLCLSGNELCGIDEDRSSGQESYDLSGLSALCRALHVNTRLKTLKIAENDIGNDGAKHVADALRENKVLAVLDLHGNTLFRVLEQEIQSSSNDSAPVDQQCSTSDRSSAMDCDHNSATPRDDEKNTVTVSEVVNQVISSTESSLKKGVDPSVLAPVSANEEAIEGAESGQQDNLSQDSPERILLAIKSSDVTYELSGMEGGGALLSAIGESIYLTSVDLSWNEMGPRGAIRLAASLQHNSTLTYLDIHGNFIGDVGISALCMYLCSNTCALAVLNAQRIGLGPVGAVLLGEALSANHT
jgi:hypothetical protein